jgi:hypothetical protein
VVTVEGGTLLQVPSEVVVTVDVVVTKIGGPGRVVVTFEPRELVHELDTVVVTVVVEQPEVVMLFS